MLRWFPLLSFHRVSLPILAFGLNNLLSIVITSSLPSSPSLWAGNHAKNKLKNNQNNQQKNKALEIVTQRESQETIYYWLKAFPKGKGVFFCPESHQISGSHWKDTIQTVTEKAMHRTLLNASFLSLWARPLPWILTKADSYKKVGGRDLKSIPGHHRTGI